MISAAIQSVLESRGERPVCDACLCDRLGLGRRQVASAAIRMARRDILRRFDGRCTGCCTKRKVVAKAVRGSAPITA
jgi:hypothetical protein